MSLITNYDLIQILVIYHQFESKRLLDSGPRWTTRIWPNLVPTHFDMTNLKSFVLWHDACANAYMSYKQKANIDTNIEIKA